MGWNGLVGVASKHSNTGQVLLSKYQIGYNSWPCEAIMEIFRANLATINQTMPNSQETVLKITLTEALVLTRQQMLMHPLCPHYSR